MDDFYILLLTRELLCVATNRFLPMVFRTYWSKAKLYSSMAEIQEYLNQTLSYDDLWAFSLEDGSAALEVGKVYRRQV